MTAGLGLANASAPAKAASRCVGGLRAVELVGVEEPLVLAPTGLHERRGVGERDDEPPGPLAGPVVEGVEGGGVVLVQGGAELVDECGALLDQRDLVAAEQAELGGQRVLRAQRPPAVTVGAEGVGEAPGVQRVVLGAGRGLAVAVAFGGLGVQRVQGQAQVEQPLDGGPAAGLDRDAETGERGGLLAERRPALGVVGEAQGQDDRAVRVDDDDLVLGACPVEAGEVGEAGEGRPVRVVRSSCSCGCGVRGSAVSGRRSRRVLLLPARPSGDWPPPPPHVKSPLPVDLIRGPRGDGVASRWGGVLSDV